MLTDIPSSLGLPFSNGENQRLPPFSPFRGQVSEWAPREAGSMSTLGVAQTLTPGTHFYLFCPLPFLNSKPVTPSMVCTTHIVLTYCHHPISFPSSWKSVSFLLSPYLSPAAQRHPGGSCLRSWTLHLHSHLHAPPRSRSLLTSLQRPAQPPACQLSPRPAVAFLGIPILPFPAFSPQQARHCTW